MHGLARLHRALKTGKSDGLVTLPLSSRTSVAWTGCRDGNDRFVRHKLEGIIRIQPRWVAEIDRIESLSLIELNPVKSYDGPIPAMTMLPSSLGNSQRKLAAVAPDLDGISSPPADRRCEVVAS